MDRFRFGLAGLGGPLTEAALYGPEPGDRLAAYGRRFGLFEAACATHPAFGPGEAQALLDRLPPHVEINVRIDTGPRARPLDETLQAAGPILVSRRSGPVHVPWHGPRTDETEQRLEAFLGRLWPRLPGHQRLAVEFHDASWLRAGTMHLLEENGAAMVWSAQAGQVPYRLTSDFIYIRLTGPTRRVPDEVASLARRVAARPDDDRPVYVVSARHLDPYGLAALERFAGLVGAPVTKHPRATAPMDAPTPAGGRDETPQRSLDGFALRPV